MKDKTILPLFLIGRLAIAWFTVGLFVLFGSSWLADLRLPATRGHTLFLAFRGHSMVCIRGRRGSRPPRRTPRGAPRHARSHALDRDHLGRSDRCRGAR